MLAAYAPPRYKKVFFGVLRKELENLAQHKIPIILTADYNIDTFKNNNLKHGCLDIITSDGFDFSK